MGTIFTLDSLREEVDREFAPVKLELGDGKIVTLRNLLRLPTKTQKQVFTLLDDMSSAQRSEDGGSGLSGTQQSAEIALQILPLVADNEKLGQQLVDALREDLALTLKVFSSWMDGAQVGEAEPSDS